VIAENEAAQKRASDRGVQLMVFNGEPFFGQDRFRGAQIAYAEKRPHPHAMIRVFIGG
jgi:hypothetical protein